MRNTTEMRQRLAEARAVLRGDAVAAVPVTIMPVVHVQHNMRYAVGTNALPATTQYALERWRGHG